MIIVGSKGRCSNALSKTASLVDRGNLILITSSVPVKVKPTPLLISRFQLRRNVRGHTRYCWWIAMGNSRKGVSHMLGVADGLVDFLK